MGKEGSSKKTISAVNAEAVPNIRRAAKNMAAAENTVLNMPRSRAGMYISLMPNKEHI